jgi:hypothetical protein
VSDSEQQKLSARSFYLKRLAYLFNLVQLWLFSLVFRASYYDFLGAVTEVSLGIMLANLLLGAFSGRADKLRFLPFILAFFILTMTLLCTPLGGSKWAPGLITLPGGAKKVP